MFWIFDSIYGLLDVSCTVTTPSTIPEFKFIIHSFPTMRHTDRSTYDIYDE